MSCCCFPATQKKANELGSRVLLDVGGKRFTTARATLTTGRAEGSLLAELVNGPPDADGAYFLDRDGSHFHVILNYLRHGPEQFVMPETEAARLTLLGEAKMMRLHELLALLEIRQKTAAPTPTPNEPSSAHVGAPLPRNEAERMEKLKSLNVLDTQNTDTEFDQITRAVAAILKVPICLVSLVAEDRQWFKSKCGLDADQTDRRSSFCAFTLLPEALQDASVLVVPDATKDTRFMHNPLVTGDPNIRFYGGCPLITSEGLRLGSLCAIDPLPRNMQPLEIGLLNNFAYLTSQALERQQLMDKEFDDSLMEGDFEEVNFLGGALRAQAMRDDLTTAVVLVWARPDSMDWPLFYANEVWTALTGVNVISPSAFPAKVQIEMRVPSSSNGQSLWDHLRLTGNGSEKVLELWRMVQAAMSSSARRDVAPGGFAVPGSVRTVGKDKVPTRTNVSCRFMPAELPLNENAAAVRATGLEHSSRRWPRPPGWTDGHWFFMQMVVDSSQSMDNGMPSSSAGPAAPRLPTVPESEGSGSGNGGSSISAMSASFPTAGSTFRQRQTSGAAEKLNMKPPRAPFEDVRLIRLCGQGSFGSVYFALWSGAACAVKIIKSVPESDEEVKNDKNHFEAVLAASISHPNLVQTFKHGTRCVTQEVDAATELPSLRPIVETWIVQEWCDGGTLRSKCKTPRTEGQAVLEGVEMLLEIAGAGAYLHDLGIIHGDLTANNVLLKSMPVHKGFTCKVCDFGLARVLDGEDQEIITQTMGTVTHMPPELFALQRDKCKLTQKADVYALGIILYHLMTGQEPFAGLTAPQVVVQVARGKCPKLQDSAPEPLRDIHITCTATDPDQRASFAELVTRIQNYLLELGGFDYDCQPGHPDPYRRCWTDPIHNAKRANMQGRDGKFS